MSAFTRILSIDGGGIRGIIPGQILVALEKKIQEITSNKNARVADYFDLIAGTSTGGILTCAYLCPNPNNKVNKKTTPFFSASEVVDLYIERGDEIFDIPLFHKIRSIGGNIDEKYPADGLEEALYDYFKDLKLSELVKPCLITAYDIKRGKGHFFTQHDTKKDAQNFFVRDVARATSAAPTYFECAKVKSMTNISYPLIDGGVFVNNPALCAYAEARKLKGKPTAHDMAILSIGTGFSKKSYTYSEAKNWGKLEWIKPLINIMMFGVSETVDYQLSQIYGAINKPKQYLRINTELPSDVNSDLDDASQDNLMALKQLGTELAEKYDKELSSFIKEMLLSNEA